MSMQLQSRESLHDTTPNRVALEKVVTRPSSLPMLEPTSGRFSEEHIQLAARSRAVHRD